VDTIGLSIERRDDDGDVVLLVAGEIDQATAPELEAHLRGVGEPASVVLDLDGVTFLDSSGLRVIVAASRELQDHQGSLRLRRAQPAVHRVLEITRLTDLLEDAS